MKLAYFRDPKGNYGDDLNPWLWDQLLPGTIDDDPSQVLVGVGTILEPWFLPELAPARTKIVMGSGGGMEVPPIRLDDSWRVYAVRGPLTASYLGIDLALAATDPAMALHDLWPRPAMPDGPVVAGRVGFMPHHSSLRDWDWRETCRLAGLDYVDPHGDVTTTTDQIAGLRLILTEAMHGAIVADALRVPWLALQINPLNYVGKWHDWGASLRMPIHFKPLPALYDPLLGSSLGGLVAQSGPRRALYEMRRRSGRRAEAEAVRMLRDYADKYASYLSDDRDLARALDKLGTALDRFRGDRAAGLLD